MNTDIGIDRYILNDSNKILGTHLATGYSVEITLTNQEMILATSKDNIDSNWTSFCDLVARRTGQIIEGEISIEGLVVNGNLRDFH